MPSPPESAPPHSTPAAGVSLSLAGRTALVTGGSRGIGAATVRLFRQAGARVAFSYRSAANQAEALASELGGPELCLALQQDLTTPEDGEALVQRTLSAFGDIDILIVNHGIWPPASTPIAAMSAAQWRLTQATNLDSVFGLCHAAAAHMLTRPRSPMGPVISTGPIDPAEAAPERIAVISTGAERSGETPASSFLNLPTTRPEALTADCVPLQPARGHIVLVASTAGQRGEAGHADYAASKGAIIALTKSLSSELAPRGIYANCVAPGWTHTEMTGSVFDSPVDAARINPTIPIGRPAHPTEIAGPILFLCTPYAGFISGEILNANGGAVLIG
jgi:3-oxoacyl-[acyl-carrier protein] reductase